MTEQEQQQLEPPGNTHTGSPVKNGVITTAVTVGILLVVSWVFSHWDLDRRIAARFYSPETGWYLREAQPWQWLYRYGTIPGIVVSLVALVGALATRIRVPESRWHKYLLLMVLTSLIGSGLLANGILKPYWGRPRPNQIQEFGGQYLYRDALSPGIPGKGKSFPSGHSTMGFLFVALVFFYRKSPVTAWTGGVFGLFYGGLISTTRVIQGAHFVTDCIWSLGLIWLTALFFYYFVLNIPVTQSDIVKPFTQRRKQGIFAAAALVAVALLSIFLTRRPYYETYYFNLEAVQTKIDKLHVRFENGYVRTDIRYADHDPLWVLVHASGFSRIGASESQKIIFAGNVNGVYRVDYRLDPHGYFSELNHELEVVIPRRFKNKIVVTFLDKAGNPVSK